MKYLQKTALIIFSIVIFYAKPAQAVVIFDGVDFGAGINDPRPNADSAASNFENALTTWSVIDFEQNPISPLPGPTNIHPDVVLTMTSNAPVGINPNPSDFATPFLGYNTTTGGQYYARLDTNASQSIPFVAIRFDFNNPINAWGAYISGLGNTAGTGAAILTAEIDDGVTAPITVSSQYPDGGILFWGITSMGNPFSQVELRLSDPSGFINANIGIDDVRFSNAENNVIPEPSTFLLLATGLLGLFIRRRIR